MVGRCAAVVTLLAWAAPARAEAPVVGGRSPRMIGRAGVGTTSDDGAGALLVNPAGLARRDGWRMQLALAFLDDEMYWLESSSAPAARDQSSSRLVPLVAIEGAIGDWVVGAGVITAARSERLLRRPGQIPPGSFGNSFEYRYAGLSGGFRRDTLTVGVARRLGDTVAVGLALGGSRVAISEERRLWAGNIGRAPTPDTLGNPAHDVELALAASDAFTPSAVGGLLVAPADSRVELAMSFSWIAPARATGEGTDILAAGTSPNTAVDLTGTPSARITVEQPVTVRTGARWLGERWIAEVGADLWWFPRKARETSWRLTGVDVVDTTTLGSRRETALSVLPSRLSTRTHGAIRGAVDVELIAGFLWATGGYAFTTPGTSGTRLSPTFGDLGGHTMALGLEGSAGGFTVTLGWARTWSVRAPEPVTAWQHDNPLGTGDGPIPTGTFDGSTDMIGVSIDAEFAAPD